MVYITIKHIQLLRYEKIYKTNTMKKIIILLATSIGFLNASCQNKKILTYFPETENDTIRTIQEQNSYYNISQKNNIPDTMALRYFFDNDIKKMYGTEEGYNVDDNSYTTVSYVKKVCPLFKKANKHLYLLCYGIKSVLYLSIYNPVNDKIINSYIISDFTDNLGNAVTHSTIFPNGYIVTVQINDNTHYKLAKIDYELQKIVILKDIKKNDMSEYDKRYKEAFSVLGITERGQLIE